MLRKAPGLQIQLSNSQASSSGRLIFGRPGSPASLFSVPLLREWSAGRRQGPGEAPYGPCEGPLCAPRQDGPLIEVLPLEGRAGPLAQGPCASRRSTAAAICGRRIPLSSSGVAIDDALDETGHSIGIYPRTIVKSRF